MGNTVPTRLRVQADDCGAQMSGYLHQRVKGAWKRQWFVLKDHVLHVYKASKDTAAEQAFPILGFTLNFCDEVSIIE